MYMGVPANIMILCIHNYIWYVCAWLYDYIIHQMWYFTIQHTWYVACGILYMGSGLVWYVFRKIYDAWWNRCGVLHIMYATWGIVCNLHYMMRGIQCIVHVYSMWCVSLGVLRVTIHETVVDRLCCINECINVYNIYNMY